MSIETTKADESVAVHVGSPDAIANEPAAPIDTPKSPHSGKTNKSKKLTALEDLIKSTTIDDLDTDKVDEIENLKSYDPFAEADEETGEKQGAHQYIHIRIQQRNGRKTLTTVQGIPPKFDAKKILKVLKKTFACNGTIVNDPEMGQVIQLQGDQRKCVLGFLVDKEEGLALDERNIKIHGF